MEGRGSKPLVWSGSESSSTVMVAFPFAGGKADLFRDWHHYFGRVAAVVYRGRFPDGERDVLLDDAEAVAAELVVVLEAELRPLCAAGKRVFFYGHSYGALVGYLVAEALQRVEGVAVEKVFVGGEQAPSRSGSSSDPDYGSMGLEEFSRHLLARNMLTEKFDREMLPLLAPTKNEFRHDAEFRLEKMRRRPEPLKCPLIAFYEAEDDSFLTVDDVEPWIDFTQQRDAFECIPVYGPHLFLLEKYNETELVDMIKERMN